MSGMGFTQFLIMGGKIVLGIVLLVGLGVPFVMGLGLGLLLYLLNFLSGMLLSLLANPIGLLIAGAITWFALNRWRKRRNAGNTVGAEAQVTGQEAAE